LPEAGEGVGEALGAGGADGSAFGEEADGGEGFSGGDGPLEGESAGVDVGEAGVVGLGGAVEGIAGEKGEDLLEAALVGGGESGGRREQVELLFGGLAEQG
jgi:hypothetical protein